MVFGSMVFKSYVCNVWRLWETTPQNITGFKNGLFYSNSFFVPSVYFTNVFIANKLS